MLTNYDYAIDYTSDADGAAETWGTEAGHGIISAAQMLSWVEANCGEACPGDPSEKTPTKIDAAPLSTRTLMARWGRRGVSEDNEITQFEATILSKAVRVIHILPNILVPVLSHSGPFTSIQAAPCPPKPFPTLDEPTLGTRSQGHLKQLRHL